MQSWQQVCIERELDNGSVAEEAECKVSSKCVARTFDNGSVPEKLGCKVSEKLVNKKLRMDQFQKNTGCRVGSKVVWQETLIMDQLQKKQSAKLAPRMYSKRT